MVVFDFEKTISIVGSTAGEHLKNSNPNSKKIGATIKAHSNRVNAAHQASSSALGDSDLKFSLGRPIAYLPTR